MYEIKTKISILNEVLEVINSALFRETYVDLNSYIFINNNDIKSIRFKTDLLKHNKWFNMIPNLNSNLEEYTLGTIINLFIMANKKFINEPIIQVLNKRDDKLSITINNLKELALLNIYMSVHSECPSSFDYLVDKLPKTMVIEKGEDWVQRTVLS